MQHSISRHFLTIAATTTAMLLATEMASAQQAPPAQYDGNNKTYQILPGSNLRVGDNITSRIVITLWQGGTLKGSGNCTQQSCPVTYNSQNLFARRSRLRISDGTVSPPGTCGTVTRRLQRGDEGGDVKRVQEALNRNGASITADGNFGRGTESALATFQRARNLSADGVAGRATLTALGCTPSY